MADLDHAWALAAMAERRQRSYHPYAPSPDGQRFLLPIVAPHDPETPAPITVILNWTMGIRR